MERLQTLLSEYLTSTKIDFSKNEWVNSFTASPFPVYWNTIFSIAKELPKSMSVLEIGAGFGLVSSIFEYLGFKEYIGYEQDEKICRAGNKLLKALFNKESLIIPERFCIQNVPSNILVLVNCAYDDGCQNKDDYKTQLVSYYNRANFPEYYLLEVIDSSYVEKNDIFPNHIRLSSNDIEEMFPNCLIRSCQTYKYPINKKSKTLYLIQKK